MNLQFTATLINPDGETFDVPCRPLFSTGALADADGTAVPQGRIRLLINHGMGVTVDWDCEFEDQKYSVLAITPFIKTPVPKRSVLTCEPVNV